MSTLPPSWVRFFLAAALSTACAGPPPESSDVDRSESSIIGGRPATRAELHSTVAIVDPWFREPLCTGTLVAPRLVVTAAHCLFEYDEAGEMLGPLTADQILIGVDTLAGRSVPEAKLVAALRSVPHPSFPGAPGNDPTGLGAFHDIGVIELARPVTEQRYVPIPPMSSLDSVLLPSTSLLVSGYGVTSLWSMDYGDLYLADVSFVRRSSHELIAGVSGEPDTCFGDSGGPAYLDGSDGLGLIGATSRALDTTIEPCGQGGLYTLVPAYASWIESVSGGTYPPDPYPEPEPEPEPKPEPEPEPTPVPNPDGAAGAAGSPDRPGDVAEATDEPITGRAPVGCACRAVGDRTPLPISMMLPLALWGFAVAWRRRRRPLRASLRGQRERHE